MKLNVVGNAKRNMLIGIVNKVIVLLLPFVVRAFINSALSSEYLGLNSLFSSVLTVLNLSEMGISSAIVYHMYKPVAENDTETVCALLRLYKKVYIFVGTLVLMIGLLIIPLLPHIINGNCPSDINLILVYLIFLTDSVISYFMYAYVSSLLTVYQRNDLISIINTVISIALNGAKIVVLLISPNYYWIIILQPVFTIINNIWIAHIVKRLYPQYTPRGEVLKSTKESIKKLVTGTFIQKVCTVTRNSLDSICTSAFLGLTLTGIYNNYYTISASISSVLGLFYSSLIGGVGNHIALKSKEENFAEMRKLDFVYLWLSGWCTTCLLCLYQPLMKLWMGDQMLLDMKAVLLFCIYFYLLKMGDIKYIYTEASGLWWEHKIRSIAEAVANLGLNILLGKYFGVYGIIGATIITIFFINYLWGSKITFRSYFGLERLTEYFRYQADYTCKTIFICLITYIVVARISLPSLLLTLIIRGIICIILPNAIYILFYRKKEEFKYVCSLVVKKRA